LPSTSAADTAAVAAEKVRLIVFDMALANNQSAGVVNTAAGKLRK